MARKKRAPASAGKSAQEVFVVGIGASAGGLEALKPLVARLEPTGRISYIVAQHLSPDHKSLMVELLARATKLPVEFARHNAEIRPDTIYVAPANADVKVDGNRLRLSVPANPHGPKPSVNLLLTSIAEHFGDHAIGVILSGTGSDGALGIKAIKEVGGITIAQKPETAKYNSMPVAAIRTGGVDVELPPEKIAESLRQLTSQSPQLVVQSEDQKAFDMRALIALIRDHTGLDFSLYKDATLGRQVARRMSLHGIQSLEDYGRYVQNQPEELDTLAQSFLICVTGFMRDPESFNSLRHYLRGLIEEKRAGGELRVWVPGCATGEEAYTLAILIDQELGDRAGQVNVRIFATDINDQAIAHARRAEYAEDAISNLPRDWINRYFREQGASYQLVERLRKMVLFTRHDIGRDPPFVRIDLISCRNLLIYFKRELQERVLKLFHYAAAPRGVLLLGNSESIGELDKLWAEVDRKHRIYRRREGVGTLPMLSLKSPLIAEVRSKESVPAQRDQDYLGESGSNRLMELYVPPSVLVTPEGSLLRFFGDCSEFLRLPRGQANFDLFSMVDPSIRAELRAGMHIAQQDQGEYRSAPFRVGNATQERWHRLVIRRQNVAHSEPPDLLLISFEPCTPPGGAGKKPEESPLEQSARDQVAELEQELLLTREKMQTVIEELETSNEELQALNEEAQAASEELQAANEELETANEELQASNEELTTLNEELAHRSVELERSNRDLANILQSMDAAVLVLDRNLAVWRHNAAAARFFAFGEAERPSLLSLKQTWAMPTLLGKVQQVLQTGQRQEFEFGEPEQAAFLARLTPYQAGPEEDEPAAGVVLHITDITQLKEYEQKLKLFASVFESASEGIIVTDRTRKVVAVNPSYSRITGFAAEEVIGRPLQLVADLTDSEREALWDTVAKDGCWNGEFNGRRKDGERLVERVSISVLKTDSGRVFGHVIIFSDITAQKQAFEQLEHQANFDPLTDLPNRSLVRDRVEQAILLDRRQERQFALLFLDLDNFKLINDAMGHTIGDRVLVKVAQRLRESVRSSDTVGRLGGDEFIILLNDIEEGDIAPLANKIVTGVTRPMKVQDQEVRVTVSVGITLFPLDGQDFDTLLKNADSAMYEAKRLGKNRYCFFTIEMQQAAVRQLWLDNQLSKALERQQMWVAYQPIVNARTGRAEAAEALMRWQHPQRGAISPADFIPVAEQNGSIRTLSLWLCEQALQAVERCGESLGAPLALSVNLSMVQVADPAHMEALIGRLERSPLAAAGRVIVEVTESMATENEQSIIPWLERLRELGCKIALDDFGTGYSSLAALKALPLDIVKIDGSFVRDIAEDPADREMIQAIIQIAAAFGLDVIVEGVETPEQRDFVVQSGAHLIQGFLYSKPLPEAELARYLEGS